MVLSEDIQRDIQKRQVSLVRCGNYNPLEVRRALRQGLELLDSPERFIRPGDRVLLKPNMLSAKEPERAVTTHPEVITAVGEMVLDCRGKIILGDSPAGAPNSLEKHWDKTGIAEVAQRLGVKPVFFEDVGVKSFKAPGGYVSISRIALEADHIINLPKLKTHMLTGMTGAVKNMFGTVPGFRKSYIHSMAPEALPFSRFVVAVYRQVVPTLNIMDAVTIMEGNGPSSGKPRHLGALIVSQDALALDNLAAQIIGMESARLPIFRAASEIGLWDLDSERTEVFGLVPSEVRASNFQQPDISKLERLPKFVRRGLRKVIWIRPRSDAKVCNACGLCVDNCPETAMTLDNDVPRINYNLCIKCGCCDEICEENAIYQEMSLMARLLA